MRGLRLQVDHIVRQLLHQVVAEDVDVELLVTWIALGQDWRDRLAQFVVVLGNHTLNDFELVYYFDSLGHFDLRSRDRDEEAHEAGSIEDELVHENVQQLHHWSLGIQQAGDVSEVDGIKSKPLLFSWAFLCQ